MDKPEGWRESKKRKGEGGKTVTKGVAGFANLSVYKETTSSSSHRPLLVANGWGIGGRVMPRTALFLSDCARQGARSTRFHTESRSGSSFPWQTLALELIPNVSCPNN